MAQPSLVGMRWNPTWPIRFLLLDSGFQYLSMSTIRTKEALCPWKCNEKWPTYFKSTELMYDKYYRNTKITTVLFSSTGHFETMVAIRWTNCKSEGVHYFMWSNGDTDCFVFHFCFVLVNLDVFFSNHFCKFLVCWCLELRI